jgi:hypothetical protein
MEPSLKSGPIATVESSSPLAELSIGFGGRHLSLGDAHSFGECNELSKNIC